MPGDEGSAEAATAAGSAAAGRAPAPRRGAPGSRRERLLDALEEVFLAEGFRRVTIGELATRLRCSRTTLYQLAAGKEELFLAVLDRFLRRIRELGEAGLRETRDPVDQLRAYLEPGVTETRSASAAFSADVDGLPEARRLLEAHQRERSEGLARLVEQGIRDGVFHGVHPELVAEVMMLAVRRVKEPDFLARADLTMSEAFEEVGRLMRHGLQGRSR